MSFRRVFALSVLIASGAAFAQQSPTTPESSPPASSTTPASASAEASHAAGPLLGDAKAGEGKAAACGACHGMDGNSSDKQYPKLAGQNEAYIARQIKLFQSQKRQNAIMMGFAATLGEQDMHDIGAYFASKSSLPGVADEKLLERGQALYRGGDGALGVPACMACHGPDGRGMAGAGYPQLAGQWADYVQAKLKDWKSGTTWGDDANAKIMPEIARRLGDADIAALASYVEGLHTASGAATASAGSP
ncbi:MAG TPA: c-type cytochrome [Rhodanobacteraceae bacterium]|jgi:cbb3-type cytochrome c oxidase subunit III|nr:c-type cytochrome [Rhodanobacteraceae bacterium]